MPIFAYATLQVGDKIPRVRDWYVNVVGLTVEQETAGQIAVLRGEGDCRLCLESGPSVSEPGRIDLLFEVASVDETHRRLTGQGVTFCAQAVPCCVIAGIHEGRGST
ncbi:MAG: VOC family protein [Gammaproteobacteria bacterium]|nr:VOC family protein [Gammaproteobacteria bacterium]